MNHFFTTNDTRTEPGRTRLNLLVCGLVVALLSGVSEYAHIERSILVAMGRDKQRVAATTLQTARVVGSGITTTIGVVLGRLK